MDAVVFGPRSGSAGRLAAVSQQDHKVIVAAVAKQRVGAFLEQVGIEMIGAQEADAALELGPRLGQARLGRMRLGQVLCQFAPKVNTISW